MAVEDGTDKSMNVFEVCIFPNQVGAVSTHAMVLFENSLNE